MYICIHWQSWWHRNTNLNMFWFHRCPLWIYYGLYQSKKESRLRNWMLELSVIGSKKTKKNVRKILILLLWSGEGRIILTIGAITIHHFFVKSRLASLVPSVEHQIMFKQIVGENLIRFGSNYSLPTPEPPKECYGKTICFSLYKYIKAIFIEFKLIKHWFNTLPIVLRIIVVSLCNLAEAWYSFKEVILGSFGNNQAYDASKALFLIVRTGTNSLWPRDVQCVHSYILF